MYVHKFRLFSTSSTEFSLMNFFKKKCEKYWPDEKEMYGSIEVTNKESKAFADHVSRVFVLDKVRQLFTAVDVYYNWAVSAYIVHCAALSRLWPLF